MSIENKTNHIQCCVVSDCKSNDSINLKNYLNKTEKNLDQIINLHSTMTKECSQLLELVDLKNKILKQSLRLCSVHLENFEIPESKSSQLINDKTIVNTETPFKNIDEQILTESHLKCGEIFITEIGSFLYFCTLCNEKLESSQTFIEHIYKHDRFSCYDKDEHREKKILNPENEIEICETVENCEKNDIQLCENIPILSALDSINSSNTSLTKEPLKNLLIDHPKKILPESTLEERENLPSKTPTGYWKCICGKICKKGIERREHEKIHRNEKFVRVICETCGKGFTNRRILIVHKRVHTGERPYKCQFCPMAFGQSGALNNHERQHTGEKPYKCKFCDKCFYQSGLCKTHELTHTLIENPFVCHVCDKRFLRPHNLSEHLKTHNFKSHKPFPCPSCPKFFKTLGTLKIHENFHRAEAYQYICQYCNKKFIQIASKEKHELLIHKQAGQFPYECNDCDKKYAHDTSLSKHRRKHHKIDKTSKQKFKCKLCDKMFTKLKSKEKHEKDHAMGPKIFQCDKCVKKYSLKDSLKKHQKKKHQT